MTNNENLVPMDRLKAQGSAKSTRSSLVRRWAPLVLLLIGLALIYATGTHKYLSLETIAGNRDTLQGFVRDHYVAALLMYMAVYVVSVAFSLPGASLLTILGGFLFGWFTAGLVTVIAATLGATLIFLIAQTSFGDSLTRKAGPWIKSFAEGFASDAFHYLLFLRLVPVFPFWLVNIAPALFGVKTSTYVWATLLGIIPGTFAFSIIGSGFDSIILAQRAAHEACIAEKGGENCTFSLDAGALVTPTVIAGFAALGVVALIPVIVKKLKTRKQASG